MMARMIDKTEFYYFVIFLDTVNDLNVNTVGKI